VRERDQPAPDAIPKVLYVAVPSALGGSNRALVTLLAALGGRVTRVVAGPPRGALKETVLRRGLAEEYVDLARARRLGRLGRFVNAARIVVWVLSRRGRISAIHANATTGFNLAAPAAILARVPLVVWVHDSVSTPWGKRLGPILGRLLGQVHWLAVSPTAADVLVRNGLCRTSDVEIVPNPIDRREVVAETWYPSTDDRVRIGFLGAATEAKGFDMLPEVVALTSDLPLRWKLFVTRRDSAWEIPIWVRLSEIEGAAIDNPGRAPDVRSAYAQCDVIFNPSRSESFSRVTAEAMLNGLTVVASDIEPIRTLIGDQGLLFAAGSAVDAATTIRRLFQEPARFGRRSRPDPTRTAELDPERVARRMLATYRRR
jgi:glycosyltransferase involved in cell wall biosynthesis